ncbi:MAG: hypothetical protein E6H57_03975 [Betaproteobacteria bacterium]|nr:MAG: hypothetical protein E6H57_03975 [Betaproteobacteria bacterium]
MRNAIASILAAAALAGLTGCESNAVPSASSMLGYQVDTIRDRSVWLTREGVLIHSTASARPVAVTLPGWLYVGSPHCPPDVALGPKGEVVVTSNVVSTLWRIDPETFAVTVHPLALDADTDKDVGFAAVVYSSEQAAFIAYSGVQRSVWRIDPQLKSAAKLANSDLSRPRQAQRVATGRGTCGNLARRLIDSIGG